MDETTATEVVDQLRTRRIFASVNRRVGVYNVGVRVVIPDGREAIWDNDGASGLEAMVLRDGVLVGYVPQIPDSDDLDASAITEIIANANYELPPSPPATPTQAPASAPESPPPAPPPPTVPASKPQKRWSLSRRRGV